MSTIGSGGAGIPPLVGSVAGTAGQQRVAGTDQLSVENSARTFEAKRQEQLQRSVGDVGNSEGVGDRDADGREAWRWHTVAGNRHHADDPAASPSPHDPDEERGQALDLNA